MKKTNKRIVENIISMMMVWGIVCVSLYFCFAFGNWELNPGDWHEHSRWWAGALMAFGFLITGLVIANASDEC